MKIVIITSSFERPLLLERLAKIVVPILLRFNGKVKWRIFIDGDDEGYKSLFQKLNNQISKSELVQWSAHKNVGKFKTLVKGLNEQKNNCDWMVNIDDDDLLIVVELQDDEPEYKVNLDNRYNLLIFIL